MSEVQSGAEPTKNGLAAWWTAVDQPACRVVRVVTVSPAETAVARARDTECCWAGTCCGRSRTTWLLISLGLGLLAVGVLVTVGVVVRTSTTTPTSVDFSGTVSKHFALRLLVSWTFLTYHPASLVPWTVCTMVYSYHFTVNL